jgi:chemotaxis signal transduction protein
MKEAQSTLTGRATELARAFDTAFAESAQAAAGSPLALLAIRVAGEPLALRLTQLAGLYARRSIVPVPSALPELLGLVGLRGAIVPVYDLGALLGRAPQRDPRWIVLAAQVSIALAFDELEGYWRLPADSVVSGPAARATAAAGTALREGMELVRTGTGLHQGTELHQGTGLHQGTELRTLVDLPGLIQLVVARAEQAKNAQGA